MRRGYLSQYFEGAAAKRLSAVEADPERSHQHEFGGNREMTAVLGDGLARQQFPARFIYLSGSDTALVTEEASVTWYDCRAEQPRRSPEYRLYFPSTAVSQCASEGDLLVIARRPDGLLLVLVAEQDSTAEHQVRWLFGLPDPGHAGFSVRSVTETDQRRLEFASRFILEEIGIELEDRDETQLDTMLRQFGGTFPDTRTFSAFARDTLPDLRAMEDPDGVLLAWMEREEILFRTLERHLVGERLHQGFDGNVEDFMEFSLSVQNRRKVRAGHALENHLVVLFTAHGVRHARGQKTERRSRPDFIFPGISEYHDGGFPAVRLTMLGVKASCRDRWRQVLSEADRIPHKHLLTLEPGISGHQTSEMQARGLSLVVPTALHATYTGAQRLGVLEVQAFIRLCFRGSSGAPRDVPSCAAPGF